MAGYTPVSNDEVRKISETYFNDRKDKLRTLDDPRLIFVEGQPGAGKTNA